MDLWLKFKGLVSCSPDLTAEEDKQVLFATEASLNSGCLPRFHVRYMDLEKLERLLTKAINWLCPYKAVINGPLFNGESKLKTNLMSGQPFSEDDAKSYLVWLYSAYLENYKTIIETNFPTLKQHFSMYSNLPLTFHLVLGERLSFFDRNRFALEIEIYVTKSLSSFSEVKIVDDIMLNSDEWCFSTGGVEFRAFRIETLDTESLFFWGYGLENEAFYDMTLRKLVYETIASELKDVKQAFRNLYKN